MTLDDLIESFRVDSDDKARSLNGDDSDLLWGDEEVVRWFAEAEEEAAIRKRLLFGEKSISVIATKRAYTFSALYEITRADLQEVGASAPLCALRIVSRDYMDLIDPSWRTRAGRPTHLIQEDTRIVLAGVVDRPYTLMLEGLRLPASPLSTDDTSVEPEIAPVHHRHLVNWVLHRAYGKQDADTFDSARSDRAEKAFTAYFGPRPDADLRKDMRADVAHHNAAILA